MEDGLLIRVLLRLYPARERARWGDDMVAAYRDQLRDARAGGRGRAWRVRLRTAAGMLRGAWAAWRDGGGTWTGGAAGEAGAAGLARTGGGGMGRTGGIGTWGSEVAQAARRLARAPGFTAVTVLTLAVGVGAFTSVWSVAESVLLRPMPYDDPGELAWVWRDYTWADFPRGWLGGPDVVHLREQSDVFEGVAAARSERRNLSGAEGTEARDVRTTVASADLFGLLGVEPALGRGFLPGEDAPGAPLVAVLGHDLWRGAFGGDPAALGSTVYLDGDPATVVGVLPEGFDLVIHSSLGEPEPADLYLPLQVDLATQDVGSGFLAGLARTREGVGAAALEAGLAAASRPVDEALGSRGLRLWAAPLREDLVGGVRTPLLAVLAAAGFLVLTLAASLATLFLARSSARERDVAVRTALGAGRGAVARTVLLEGTLLALAGGALGVAAGSGGARLLGRAAANVLPRAGEIGLDGTGALLGLATALALGLLASVLPLLRVLGLEPGASLREGGSRGGGSPGASRGRGALVVAQVALSMVLLVGAGLLGRSVAALLAVDPGFDPGSTLTFRVALDRGGYATGEEILAFHDRLRERLAALPGVTAVGIGNALPLGQDTDQTGARFPDAPGNTGEREQDSPLVDAFAIDAGYVAAAGLRVSSGRAFEPEDAREGQPPVVLVDDVLARRFFPDGNAEGARIVLGGDTATVVGVVDQARFYDVHRDDRGQVYAPLAWQTYRRVRVAVRLDAGAGDPTALAGAARDAVRSLDPRIPVSEVSTLRASVRASLGDQRMSLALVAAFAAGALLLTSLALYGVVAGTVARRRSEIGVRMAMGAARRDVVGLVLGQGLRLVLAGLVLGTGAAWLGGRVAGALLFGVSAFDPPTYLAVAALLGAVALLASWLPARTAARIAPREALRAG